MIKLHNSLSRSLEEFIPSSHNVTMYVCGITPYSTPHIGNARPAVIFDVLFRLLQNEYGENAVKYARNLTDIDDKIIDRAKENNETIYDLTARTIAEYHTIMVALNVKTPTFEPRATDYVNAMQHQIQKILSAGHAYEAEGHVLFDIASFPSHGILSGHKQEDLDAGHRVAVASYKKSDGDFVLWKPTNEPAWDSPWGRGRMGWSIECSSMIESIFNGETIDIHGGGADLRFPHHDCEISQFSSANNKPLANYWLHNAMVIVDGQKMAKSVGNVITVDDLLKNYKGQILRLALLTTHYRSSLDWTDELLSGACQTLIQWHRTLNGVSGAPIDNEHSQSILRALKDDLNTPLAIARIHEKLNNMVASEDEETIASGIRFASNIMGIDLEHNEEYLRGGVDRKKIEQLLEERNFARQEKNFETSDRIRKLLENMGLVIEDNKAETQWWVR